MKRLIILLIALIFTLVSCDREYVVENVDGTWQMSNASITINVPGADPVEASSTKQLFSGILGLVKRLAPDEDFSEAEAEIEKMEDNPFAFTEDETFRLEFKKDGTFCSWAKDENGTWIQSDTMGEYSYAGYRLTMYDDVEDGKTRTVPAVILKLTNRQLILQLKMADMFGMPVTNPLSGEIDGSDEGSAVYMAMLNYIDITTALTFDRVKKKK